MWTKYVDIFLYFLFSMSFCYICFLPLEEEKISQSEMPLDSVINTAGNIRLDRILTVSSMAARLLNIFSICVISCRSQWPRGLSHRSTAARLLRSWVKIPPGAWMFVCCVLSGRGLCDELITHPEESYRLWRVVLCDQETSWTRRP
jgi:hypothetical protein